MAIKNEESNCTEQNCKYFNLNFELHCSYSVDNSLCWKIQTHRIEVK